LTTLPFIGSILAPQRSAARARKILLFSSATLICIGVGIWLVTAFIKNPSLFLTSTVIGLSNGALYALVALGYTLVYGIIELINFAHGDLFMLGTLFVAFITTSVFGVVTSGASVAGWLIFAVTLVLSVLFCGSINVAIEFVAYRRLRRAPKLAPLITAVGMSFILLFIGLTWNGSNPRADWRSVLPQGEMNLGGVSIQYKSFFVIGITGPLLLLMTWIVTKTRTGKAMRAVAQDQDAARLMGINVNRIISFTFALGGGLAGAAAVLYEQVIGTTVYNLGFQFGLIAFTAAVLGGIGSLPGAVLGGLLIGVIKGLNEGVGLGQNWGETVVFTILILVMVFRPTGLLGSSLGEKV
jgi:branched-chain amino acid transport system permease protein